MFSARNGFYYGSSLFKTGMVGSIDHMSTAIKSDGTLWVWGIGDNGNLGLNDTLDRSVPVQLGTSNWTQIALNADSDVMYAIKPNGTLWAWGAGGGGINASNSTINRSSPVQITTATNWSSLASSGAINSLNQLFVWGVNTYGSLGLGDRVNRSSPTQLAGEWIYASINDSISAGIKGDGTLWTWGGNFNGTLGTNNTIYRSSPVQIASSANFNQVSVFGSGGGGGGAAISNDLSLWVWGWNINGMVPAGDTINRSSPVQIAGTWSSVSLSNRRGYGIQTDGSLWGWGTNDGMLGVNATQSWSQISSTSDHTLAIRDDGSLWAWGAGVYGQLGLNSTGSTSTPILVSSDIHIQVSASLYSSYAIRNDSSLWAWGRNNFSQLGDGTTINKSSPIQIGSDSWIQLSASKLTNAVLGINSNNTLYGWGTNSTGQLGLTTLQVTSGGFASYVLRSDGILYAVGYNNNGELGQNNTIARSNPVQLATDIQSIENSFFGGAYIKTDGTLWIWGYNASGQLGLGDTITRSSPVQLGSATWRMVTIQNNNNCYGITTSNTLYAWGDNQYGQLGIGDTIARSSPVQISGTWNQISIGFRFALAIDSTNKLYAWGFGQWGQLGIGFLDRSSPVQVGTSSWSSVSAGDSFTVAITTSNTMWSWGANDQGQLGINNTIIRSTPVQISGTWSKVSAGRANVSGHTSAAIDSLGRLWTWGNNDFGQLGINTRTTLGRSAPVQVTAITDSWSQISSNGATLLGVTNGGVAYTWGYNGYGQLGINDIFSRSTPIQISTNTNTPTKIDSTNSYSQISAGGSHSMAIRTNNTLWTWGTNTSGQLGDSTTISKYSPVQIGALTNWSTVSAGGIFSLAVNNSSVLYAWGSNSFGQLGINDIVNRSSPVQVGTSSWSQVSAGSSFALGVTIDNSVVGWGQNTNGQLALMNLTANRSNPVQIPLFSSPNLTSSNVMVIAGDNTAFHINKIGSLWAWGDNSSGQLGIVPTAATYTIPQHIDPVRILTSPIQLGVGNSWTIVSAATYELGATASNPATTGAIAKTDQDAIYIWGLNSAGSTPFYRTGNGTLWGAEPVPTQITF